jgi:predicted transcriptional regulator
MVAPNYSNARSELAKSLGLGQVRKGQAQKAGKKASKKKAA